jgi:ribosomal protein S18 acetylase RimI-like enzyme
MKLEFRPFQEEWYPEYAAWFADAELNRRLGPMDLEWLDATLSMREAAGMTWAIFREGELVAVIETAFDPDAPQRAAITALATKPHLRRQGIGRAVLEQLLEMHYSKGIHEHWAHLAASNQAARNLLEGCGFKVISDIPNEHGYIEFERHDRADG